MLYRQIILEWGQDTESGVWGLGYSPDNGKNFYVLNTTHGRKYRAEDGNRLYPYISDQIQDKIDTVVAPAKSAADSAVNAADAAVASAQVTSDAVSAIASATAEAKQGANEAMSRAKSAWDVATGAKEAVTDFDPLLKSAQSDASNALTQIADTANALSDAKISFGSDVAAAKELANTAQTTADSAVQSASENAKALTSQANAMSDAKKAIDSDVASAKGLADAAQATADNAIKSASSVADDLTAVANQAKSNASGITKVTSDVGLLQTTVADNSGNISTIQETTKQIQQAVSDNAGNITTAKQTADSAATVASDAKSNATVAIQTASQASITASSASGQAASAVLTANGAMTTASNAKSDATVAIQTASGASLTATNAKSDATVAKQTASEAKVRASDAKSDFAQLSIRANKIEANVANNSGAIASVQQTANGLTATVADIKANGGGVNLAHNTSNAYVVPGDPVNGYKNIGSLSNDEWASLAGETITIGVTVEWTNWQASGNNRIGFELAPSKNGKGYWDNAFGLWCHPVNGSSGKQRLTATRTINNDIDGVNEGFAYVQGKCDTAKISELMIERGSVAHDWSPSPDDLQNQFTQIKQSIDGVTTTINDPKTGLNATYQTAAGNATTISNVKGDVTQLQTTATGLTSRVGNLESKTNTQETEIQQNKNAIALKAAQTDVDTVKGTVTGLQSSLTVQGNQIQTKVSASDVSGMLKGYATQDYTQSLVTQQANTLSSTITTVKNQVNSLESTIDWTTKTGSLDMDTLTTTQNIYYRDTNLKNADGEAGWAYIQVVSMGERVTQTVWHDRSSIQHTRTGAVSGSSYNWDAWNRTATNAQISNLTQSLDGLQSTVATKADQSTVTQLSNLIQTKVSSGDFTSTTTQLKNEINQRVQVGDVISQINQEAGGNTLIQVSNGKKSLILDAANTIITGEAWIPSAAIANLTADDITTGTLKGVDIDFRNSSGQGVLIKDSTVTFDDGASGNKAGYLSFSNMPIADWPSGTGGNELQIKYGESLAIIATGDTNSRALFSAANTQIGYHQQGDTSANWGLTGLKIDNIDRQINLGVYGSDGKWTRLLANPGNVDLNAGDAHCHLDGGRLHYYKDNDNNSPIAVELQVDGWAWVRGWVEAAGHSQHSALSTKTDIQSVDDDKMLKMVNDTDLTTFLYKTDVANGETHRHIGPIIDDVHDVAQYQTPQDFIAPNGVSRDDDNMIGALFGAVKALTKRIKTLESKVG